MRTCLSRFEGIYVNHVAHLVPKLSTLAATPHSGEAERVERRIKALQEEYEQTLPAESPYVLRLDGVAFRSYTAGMRKPFDARLTRAMQLTTRDLMERCAARTGYCQSDEITLVFAPEGTPHQIIYGGRVQKIVSIMASWAAARFNYHIARMDWQDVEEEQREKIGASQAIFDARIFHTPDDIMAAEAIYWRHALDGRRNAINMIGHSCMDKRELFGLSLGNLVDRLRRDHQINPYKDFPPSAIYGTFLKKRLMPHVGLNPKTGQTIATVRARIEARSFDWTCDELSRGRMVMDRHWDEQYPASLELIDLESTKNKA